MNPTPDTRRFEQRRHFLRCAAGLAASVIPLAALHAAELPHLAADDPTRQALGYVDDAALARTHKAYVAGSQCAGCMLFEDDHGAAWGRCATFPGKSVSRNGWCAAFVSKG